MRIGTNYNLLIMKQNMERARREHGELAIPMSTGRKLNRISDDPSRLTTVMDINQSVGRRDQFLFNINAARARLNITESVMGQINGLVQEAYSLAIQGNNQALTQAEIGNITSRLTAIKADVLSLANAKQGGIYLFSGFKSTTQPFTGAAGVFNGDTGSIAYKVSATKSVAVNVDGSALFTGGSGNTDVFGTFDNLIADVGASNSTNIGTRITELQNVMSKISTDRASIGGNVQSLQFTEDVLDDTYRQNAERLSAINDVDMAEAASDLSLKEFLLQAAVAVSRRVMSVQLQSFFE